MDDVVESAQINPESDLDQRIVAAIKEGNAVKVCEALVEGAKPNLDQVKLAIDLKQGEIVQALVKVGVTMQTFAVNPVFQTAKSEKEFVDIANALIEHNDEVSVLQMIYLELVRSDHKGPDMEKTLVALIDKGLPLDAHIFNSSPLQHTVRHNRGDFTKILLEKGADHSTRSHANLPLSISANDYRYAHRRYDYSQVFKK